MGDSELIVFLMSLVSKFPIVGLALAVLGLLVVLGSAVVAMTPSTEDDLAWAKLEAMPVVGTVLKVLASFSPIQKKMK